MSTTKVNEQSYHSGQQKNVIGEESPPWARNGFIRFSLVSPSNAGEESDRLLYSFVARRGKV